MLTAPAFYAPAVGVPVKILLDVWHGKTRMAWLHDDEKFFFKICLLFILAEFNKVT